VDSQGLAPPRSEDFTVEKFTATPDTPPGPLAAPTRQYLSDFVEADLNTQASHGVGGW
jgi:hypothetical protein